MDSVGCQGGQRAFVPRSFPRAILAYSIRPIVSHRRLVWQVTYRPSLGILPRIVVAKMPHQATERSDLFSDTPGPTGTFKTTVTSAYAPSSRTGYNQQPGEVPVIGESFGSVVMGGCTSMSENPYSLQAFLEQTRDRDLNQGLFELESERMLDINLNGEVWTKLGAMVAYTGNVKFEREGILSRGIGNLLKKAVSGEGSSLTKVSGQGSVFCADAGKKITILRLDNEAICVNGNDLLAFETSLDYNIKMMKRMTAMLAGGLFNVRLEGHGMVAITSHYDPVTLPVAPDHPVVTDPNATVLWSGHLEPELKTDLQFKTFLGRGSGDSVQLLFRGQGFVVVQPYEEVYFQQSAQ